MRYRAGMSRFVLLALGAALLAGPAAVPIVRAADASAVRVETAVPPIVVAPVLPPVPVVILAPTYRDPRTGRCLPGFTLNRAGACVRHDDPYIVCVPADFGPDACVVAPPHPAPYGIGASLRLNY